MIYIWDLNLMELISYKNMPCPGNHVTLQILRESLSRNIPDNAIGLPLYRCSLLLETDRNNEYDDNNLNTTIKI